MNRGGLQLTILRVTSGVGGDTACLGALARGGVEGFSMCGDVVHNGLDSLMLERRG
jgi:hypothetical protein